MAESKPLALRRQKIASRALSGSFTRLAEVVVDHPSFHISEPFSYGIPDSIKDEVAIGSWVRVPFQSQILDGVVISISELQATSAKPLSKILKFQPLSSNQIALMKEIAQRYGVRLVDILRFIPRVPIHHTAVKVAKARNENRVTYRSFSEINLTEILDEIVDFAQTTLVIVPTERQAEYLTKQIRTRTERPVIHFRSEETKPQLKAAWSLIQSSPNPIILGSRSAVFLEIVGLQRIYLLNELSDHLWERRSPYWNARDVLLLKSRLEGIELRIISGSPSMELARLLELGGISAERRWLRPKNRRQLAFLPSSYHATIRNGIKSGSVLVSVAEKGYSSSLVCKKCRSVPRCNCGGRLAISSRGIYTCNLCSIRRDSFQCLECGSNERLMLRRGAERITEELGKSFPNVNIAIATSEREQPQISDHMIIVATSGVEPIGYEYSGLVLLDGELHFNRPHLRAAEILLDKWMSLVSMTSSNASIFLSLEASNPISRAISRGDASAFSKVELAERKNLALPPWYRIIQLKGAGSALHDFSSRLINEFPFVKASMGLEVNSMTLRVPVERSEEVISSLFAVQKYRSATRQKLFEIRIDQLEI